MYTHRNIPHAPWLHPRLPLLLACWPAFARRFGTRRQQRRLGRAAGGTGPSPSTHGPAANALPTAAGYATESGRAHVSLSPHARVSLSLVLPLSRSRMRMHTCIGMLTLTPPPRAHNMHNTHHCVRQPRSLWFRQRAICLATYQWQAVGRAMAVPTAPHAPHRQRTCKQQQPERRPSPPCVRRSGLRGSMQAKPGFSPSR